MKIAYLFLALLFGVGNAQCVDSELQEGLLNQENQIFTIKDIHGDVLASIPLAVMQKLSPLWVIIRLMDMNINIV